MSETFSISMFVASWAALIFAIMSALVLTSTPHYKSTRQDVDYDSDGDDLVFVKNVWQICSRVVLLSSALFVCIAAGFSATKAAMYTMDSLTGVRLSGIGAALVFVCLLMLVRALLVGCWPHRLRPENVCASEFQLFSLGLSALSFLSLQLVPVRDKFENIYLF